MRLIRPLLQTDRSALEAYAKQQQLNWIEDPSNLNTDIRRNFLRHQVWSSLKQRWPALNQTLARSAAHLAEAQQLLDERAEDDLQALSADAFQRSLNVPALLGLSAARQRNVLRFFIRKLGFDLPSTAVLQCLIDELCLAKLDAMPQVRWADVEARRYRDNIFFSKTTKTTEWIGEQTISSLETQLLGQDQKLVWQEAAGQGIQESVITAGLTLRFRQGGEKIQLSQNGPQLSLKNLFQQWAIPPWQRSAIPLLFAEDKLIAVVGYAISAEVKVGAQQQGWLPTIQPAEHAFFD
jgi:tRNA(Ile)-lysidine synthase